MVSLNLSVFAFDGLMEVIDKILHLEGLRAVVLALHHIFVVDMDPFLFHYVEFRLKFFDVLTFASLHLAHDFFLCVQLTIKVLRLAKTLIDLVLEFGGLFLEQLDLPIGCVQLDLCALHVQGLVFQVRFS